MKNNFWLAIGITESHMQLKAVILDVDGTLADTEKWAHLPACNEAFQQMGLPIKWDWEYFKDLIAKIQGNANRLRNELNQKFNLSSTEIESIIIDFEIIKKELYINKYLPEIKLRKGVYDFIKHIHESQLQLAIVSTSYEAQIKALIKNKLAQFYSSFNPILGKETGKKTGENGVLYSKCLDNLGLAAENCLVIEDSEIGLKAALKAKIPTVITYNDYTKTEDFEGAELVLDSLEKFDFNNFFNRYHNN